MKDRTKINDLSDLWLPIFEILALESADRFLGGMGLKQPVTKIVREAARYYVCNYFKPDQDQVALLERTLQEIEEHDEKDFIKILIDWMMNLYSNHPLSDTITIWSRLLTPLSNPTNEYLLNTLTFTKNELSQLKLILKAHQERYMLVRQKIDDARAEIAKEMQSLWIGCYNYLYYIEPSTSPYLSLQSYFELQKLLWKHLEESFSYEQLSQLRDWAKPLLVEAGEIREDKTLDFVDTRLL